MAELLANKHTSHVNIYKCSTCFQLNYCRTNTAGPDSFSETAEWSQAAPLFSQFNTIWTVTFWGLVTCSQSPSTCGKLLEVLFLLSKHSVDTDSAECVQHDKNIATQCVRSQMWPTLKQVLSSKCTAASSASNHTDISLSETESHYEWRHRGQIVMMALKKNRPITKQLLFVILFGKCFVESCAKHAHRGEHTHCSPFCVYILYVHTCITKPQAHLRLARPENEVQHSCH